MKKTLLTLAIFIISNPLWANNVDCKMRFKDKESYQQLEKIEVAGLLSGSVAEGEKVSFANVVTFDDGAGLRLSLESFQSDQAIPAEEQAQAKMIPITDLNEKEIVIEDSQAELKCKSKI